VSLDNSHPRVGTVQHVVTTVSAVAYVAALFDNPTNGFAVAQFSGVAPGQKQHAVVVELVPEVAACAEAVGGWQIIGLMYEATLLDCCWIELCEHYSISSHHM
jgi:hypothetical protein